VCSIEPFQAFTALFDFFRPFRPQPSVGPWTVPTATLVAYSFLSVKPRPSVLICSFTLFIDSRRRFDEKGKFSFGRSFFIPRHRIIETRNTRSTPPPALRRRSQAALHRDRHALTSQAVRDTPARRSRPSTLTRLCSISTRPTASLPSTFDHYSPLNSWRFHFHPPSHVILPSRLCHHHSLSLQYPSSEHLASFGGLDSTLPGAPKIPAPLTLPRPNHRS
jgi:hypothetical protein